MRSPGSIFSLAALFLVPVLSGAPQLAHAAGKDRQPGTEKLPVGALTVNVRSWNGRVAPPRVTPTRPVNVRWPSRAPDPMAVVVAGAHPRTKVTVLRQKQSGDVTIPGTVADTAMLEQIADEAADYVEMASFTTSNRSSVQPNGHIVTEAAKVAWPHARILVKATTRDGQKYADTATIVEGLEDHEEQRYDAVTNGPVNYAIGGRQLPASRAWIKTKNVFVSEPARNTEIQKQGRDLDAEAGREERELAGIPGKIERLQAKVQTAAQQGADYTKIQETIDELTNRQYHLQQTTPQKRQDAATLIARGKKLTVQVVSVGGTPAATPMRVVNTRLAGEQGADVLHSTNPTTAPRNGFMSTEVEALDDDEITMRADFTGGNANSSWATTTFRVPAATSAAKPAFTMNGVKFYRVDSPARADHDPDPVDPAQP